MTGPDHAETERVLLDTLTEIFILEILRKAVPLTIRQVSRHAGLPIYEADAALRALCREGVAERAPDAGRAWRYQARPRQEAEPASEPESTQAASGMVGRS